MVSHNYLLFFFFLDELNKRNDIIKSLTKKLKLLESQQSDSKAICEITQQKFKELSQKLIDVTLHCQGLEVGVE